MKKSIIAIALVILIICVVFTACKSKKGETAQTTAKTNGVSEAIMTDPDTGEMYVTNKDGDRIPFTTSLDGSVEFVEDLITKTKEQVSSESEEILREKESMQHTTTTAPATTNPASSPNEPTTGSQGVDIGSGDIFDESNAAVINWD